MAAFEFLLSESLRLLKPVSRESYVRQSYLANRNIGQVALLLTYRESLPADALGVTHTAVTQTSSPPQTFVCANDVCAF
jgi:hypothetical protein